MPSTEEMAATSAELVSVKAVARMLGCSESHVWRMDRTGKMPEPVKLLRSVRWRRRELLEWIEAGCPPRTKWS